MVASTTTLIFFSWTFSMICSYISSGNVLGILPEITNTSSWVSCSNWWNKAWISSSWISGPIPLISVSSLDFIFTLIRDNPFLTWMKSVLAPKLSSLCSISFPVKPAIKPSAVLSSPKLESTIETLMPFPPGKISSNFVLLMIPGLKLSTWII